jgi:hypothetical protein
MVLLRDTLSATVSLDTHFGYELNLYKASNDFYAGKDLAFKGFATNFEVEVTYQGPVNGNRDIDVKWTMELAIPLANFVKLGQVVPVIAGNRWAFLAVRQDRNDGTGSRRWTSAIFPIYDFSKNSY